MSAVEATDSWWVGCLSMAIAMNLKTIRKTDPNAAANLREHLDAFMRSSLAEEDLKAMLRRHL